MRLDEYLKSLPRGSSLDASSVKTAFAREVQRLLGAPVVKRVDSNEAPAPDDGKPVERP